MFPNEFYQTRYDLIAHELDEEVARGDMTPSRAAWFREEIRQAIREAVAESKKVAD
jgi:hypothetical protein